MPSIDEKARVIADLLEVLSKAPTPKENLRQRLEGSPAGYRSVIGALRMLGIIEPVGDQVIGLTAIGLYVAGHPSVAPATAIAKALRKHRGNVEGAKSYAGGAGLPSQEALAHGLSTASARSVRELVKIRDNVIRLLERELFADLKFGLNLYLRAIDLEFEKRPAYGAGDDWFRWPSTDAPEGFGNMVGTEFMPEGMLGAMGYRVGVRGGLPEVDRRRLLDQVFERILPPLFPPWYMEKWGIRGIPLRGSGRSPTRSHNWQRILSTSTTTGWKRRYVNTKSIWHISTTNSMWENFILIGRAPRSNW